MNIWALGGFLLFAFIDGATQESVDGPAEKTKGKVEFRRAETTPADGLIEAIVPGTNQKVYLRKDVEATNDDFAKVRAAVDDRGAPAIEINFTKVGAKKMAKLSEKHIGKRLAILVDGTVVSAPIVNAKFSEKALIMGTFTKLEVEELVKDINAK